jgi:large subunit ribosomal protein L44e
MKYPKKIRTLCPYCRKQTEHTVKQSKKKVRDTAHPMSQSAKRKDRHKRGYGGHGKYSKPAVSKKPSQRLDLRLTCSECGKAHTKTGFRIRKFEVS